MYSVRARRRSFSVFAVGSLLSVSLWGSGSLLPSPVLAASATHVPPCQTSDHLAGVWDFAWGDDLTDGFTPMLPSVFNQKPKLAVRFTPHGRGKYLGYYDTPGYPSRSYPAVGYDSQFELRVLTASTSDPIYSHPIVSLFHHSKSTPTVAGYDIHEMYVGYLGGDVAYGPTLIMSGLAVSNNADSVNWLLRCNAEETVASGN